MQTTLAGFYHHVLSRSSRDRHVLIQLPVAPTAQSFHKIAQGAPAMPHVHGPTTQHLHSLKLVQLKYLASSIGVASSGNKDALSRRLWGAIHGNDGRVNGHRNTSNDRKQSQGEETKILSIDMGIKNFAYCALGLPMERNTSISGPSQNLDKATTILRPKLYAWEKRNLTSSSPSSDADAHDWKDENDQFHPQKLAEQANQLVKELVTQPLSKGPPDIILIERQRFRTMGSAVVQEWTLRVNTLEAMLWAILQAERERGTWGGVVCGVSPSLVAGWWQKEVPGGLEGLSSTACEPQKKLSPKQKKAIRIERAADALQNSVEIVSPAAQDICDTFQQRTSRGRPGTKTRMGTEGDALRKLDDLADCLIQALTWAAWQRNRRTLLTEGADGLNRILTQPVDLGTL